MIWRLAVFLIGCCTGVILLIFIAIYVNCTNEAKDVELFDKLSNYELQHNGNSSRWSVQPYYEFEIPENGHPV